jgi:hypothetical protein
MRYNPAARGSLYSVPKCTIPLPGDDDKGSDIHRRIYIGNMSLLFMYIAWNYGTMELQCKLDSSCVIKYCRQSIREQLPDFRGTIAKRDTCR